MQLLLLASIALMRPAVKKLSDRTASAPIKGKNATLAHCGSNAHKDAVIKITAKLAK